MIERVAITGIGTVSASGTGVEALVAKLREGRPELSEVDLSKGYHQEGSARTANLLKCVDFSRWISPLVARRLNLPSRSAVLAAQLALSDAGLEISKERDSSTSVALANAFGPLRNTQKILDQILEGGPETISPSLFTECVANAPAANVAIHCRASGPNHTICEREAGPLIAVGKGAADIQSGKVCRSLVGSAEEITPLLHSILDRFGALARATFDRSEIARPFDRRRNGFTAAEGATVLILEGEETVKSRKANVLARVRGWGSAFDPTASRVGWGRGVETLENGLRRCLKRFDLELQDIDLIVSGASGSIYGDRIEAQVLRKAWHGLELPPILVPKGITGEYGGAFLGAAVLAVCGYPFGPVPGFEELDPDLNIVPNNAFDLPKTGIVLVTTLSSGGSGSWLILERP